MDEFLRKNPVSIIVLCVVLAALLILNPDPRYGLRAKPAPSPAPCGPCVEKVVYRDRPSEMFSVACPFCRHTFIAQEPAAGKRGDGTGNVIKPKP